MASLIAGGIAASSCATTDIGPPAEEASAVEPSVEVITAYYNQQGNPLASLVTAEAERRQEGFSAQANWVSGLWHAQLGEFALAAAVYTPLSGTSFGEEPDDGECDGVTVPDSVEAFCERILTVGRDVRERNADAEPPQFVFIEDQPNLPAMRVFGQKILQCARDAGFSHLAVEALQEPGEDVTARGHVTLNSGLLTREPQLARLIREGVELGYNIVNYDAPNRPLGNSYFTDVDFIAETQAANLLSKTYDVDSSARVLVWTMPFQARKQEWRRGTIRRKSVAAYVFEQTGLEPYSLEQETLEAGFTLGGATNSGSFLVSGIGDNSDCAWSFFPLRSVELSPAPLSAMIMHTVPRDGAARWNWLNAVPDERMTVTASCTDCRRLLVQAVPVGEDASVVIPTDQAICQSDDSCQLVLPPGEYDLVVWGEEGDSLGTQTATFEAGGSVSVDL